MNSPSEDIKDMLEALSESTLIFGENLFIGREPKAPNNCTTIFDTPGGANTITLDQKSYEYPSVQIRIRNSGYQDGYDLADQIKTILHGRANETWGNYLYTIITSTNPSLLDWDDNDRARFIININIQRRKNDEQSN